MSYYRFGFWMAMVFMLVDLGQAHQMLPLIKYLKLGAISELIVVIMVAMELPKTKWFTPLAFFRILFIISIGLSATGGFGLGHVRDTVDSDFFRLAANFLGLTCFARSIDDLKRIHLILIWLALALSIYVITHGGHGPGLLVDENDVGLSLVMLLPFPFLMTAVEKRKGRNLLYLGIFAVILMAITATFSRGTMVGAIPTLLFIWFRSKRKVVTLFGVILLCAAAVALAPKNYIGEFESIGKTDEGTAATRIYYWHLSIQLYKVRPITGVGANNWGNAVWSGVIPKPELLSNLTPHSIYFQLLSEMGTVGTVVWVGLLITLVATILRLRKAGLKKETDFLMIKAADSPLMIKQLQDNMVFMDAFANALLVSLVGYLFAGAFISVLFYPEMMALVAFAQAATLCWKREFAVRHHLLSRPAEAATTA